MTVARVEEVPPGTIRPVQAGEGEIALANCASGFYAVQQHCLHLQGPLGEGRLEGCVLTCPWHGWQYDVRTGQYFAAHEELEDAWRAAPPDERDFFQGLVHVAVAWYQAGRGRRIGTERQLEKAIRRLQPFAPAHRGVELDPLLAQLRELRSQGSLDLPAPIL